jgi:hypothetical protein
VIAANTRTRAPALNFGQRQDRLIIALRGDLNGLIRWLAFLSAFLFTFAAAAVAFRLGMQFSAAERGGLVGLMYDVSGVFTSPFDKFETVTPREGAPIVEFSTLLALEVYLVAGLLVIALLISLAKAIGGRRLLAWRLRLDVTPVADALRAMDARMGEWAAAADRSAASAIRSGWAATGRRLEREPSLRERART